MQIETEIKKWGNSLALRVSGSMAEVPGFSAGTRVTVDISEEGLVIKPVVEEVREPRLPYSEKELLADMQPPAEDLLATLDDGEWGED